MKQVAEMILLFALIGLVIIPNAISCEAGLVPSPAQAAPTVPEPPKPSDATAAPPETEKPAPTAVAEPAPAAPATDATPAADTAPAAGTTPAVEPPTEPAVMTELGVELVNITPDIRSELVVEITIRTLPGATVFLQPVNPSTGTRSAWPKEADGGKIRIADEFGMATWTWTIYKMVIPGPGTLEFLVTTSTDADYIGKWKPTMTRRSMDGFAARDDTVLVVLPWTIRP